MNQGETCCDGEGVGRSILQISSPCVNPGRRPLETFGPHRHPRVLERGAGTSVRKKCGSPARVRVGEREGLVEDAVEKYEAYFPGHNPIPMEKVVNGYIKSVLGHGTGEIIRMYDNC